MADVSDEQRNNAALGAMELRQCSSAGAGILEHEGDDELGPLAFAIPRKDVACERPGTCRVAPKNGQRE